MQRILRWEIPVRAQTEQHLQQVHDEATNLAYWLYLSSDDIDLRP